MDKRTYAKRYLTHYFRLLAKASGIQWDSDNEAEVECIVDFIIDTTKAELREEDNE